MDGATRAVSSRNGSVIVAACPSGHGLSEIISDLRPRMATSMAKLIGVTDKLSLADLSVPCSSSPAEARAELHARYLKSLRSASKGCSNRPKYDYDGPLYSFKSTARMALIDELRVPSVKLRNFS